MKGIRFRLAGIPVYVEPAFMFLALIIAFLGRSGINIVLLILAVFISVLVHELGHALAFRAFGRQPTVVLHGLGGVTSAEGSALSRGKDVIVTVAGSASQILLLGLPAAKLRDPLAFRYQSEVVFDALTDLAWVSLAWGFLNLMPVIPLDGGKIMARVLEIFSRNSALIAHWVSAIVAAGGATWGLLEGEPFLGIMGLMLVGLNMRGIKEQRDAPQHDRLREGHRLIDAGDPNGALRIAEELRRRGTSADVSNAGLDLAAWAHLARGDQTAAEGMLLQRKGRAERSGYLAGYTALDRGDREAALVMLVRAYMSERPFPSNRLLATRLAREGLIDTLAEQLLEPGRVAGAAAVATLAHNLHDAGLYDESLRLRMRLFELGLDPAGDAYNVACTYARLGDRDNALAWLKRALDQGFDDAAVIDRDDDLDTLRGTDEFAAQRGRLDVRPA
jgi:Zn-dependent protease